MERVDIILPTRNRLNLTSEAIASVQAQTWQDWDLWVIDDGSDDGSFEALKDLTKDDPRVHVVSQLRSGPSLARDAGFRMGEAPWVALLDSDDLWIPTKLEKQISASGNRDVVLCWHEWFRPDGTIRVTRKIHGDGRVPPTLSNNMSSPLIRRELLSRIGGIRNPETIPNVVSCEHVEFFLRLLLEAQVVIVPEVLVRCRDHRAARESDRNTSILGALAMDEIVTAYASQLRVWPTDLAHLISAASLRLISAGLARHGYRRYFDGFRVAPGSMKLSMLRRHGPFLVKNLPRLAGRTNPFHSAKQ